jgi:tol-pal system protein YbgF
MRFRNIATFGAALLAGAIVGSAIGPRPAEAVAREIIELQRDVTTLLQGQKDMTTQMTQDHAVLRTIVQQASDNVDKLNTTMGSLQKSVQDVQANSGARLDTMSTQIQGLSDNLQDIQSRIGKLNQQLVDLQSSVQSIDAKLSGNVPAGTTPGTTPTPTNPTGAASNFGGANPPAGAAPAPNADTLYSNGLRDITSGNYDLARSEFQDYLKYYGNTDLASNAQFYLGEIAYAQKRYSEAITQYDKVLNNYPKSFKLASALYQKGMALLEMGQRASGVRELRAVIKRFPGTEEERRARAKLKELGEAVAANR